MFSNHTLYKEDVAGIAGYAIDWSQLRDKSILITGASGLIGTFLIDVLMYRNNVYNDNITIYAVVRNKEKAIIRFNDYLNNAIFVLLQQDIQYPISIDNSVDYIIHGASNVHPIAYATEPINTILTIINGTKNILDFSFKKKVKRTIFISSSEIYGINRGDVDFFSEDYCGYLDCNTVRAGYAEGKRAAETLCQAYIKEKEIDVIIARSCHVYGPTHSNNDSKVIAQFLRNAKENKDIVLKSKGEQQFSYCYVADVCLALLVMLLRGENSNAYNISDSSCDISLLQIAKILTNHIQKDIVFDLPDSVESEGYSKATKRLLDSKKLERIGWKSHYSINDGLIRTVKILKNLQDNETNS